MNTRKMATAIALSVISLAVSTVSQADPGIAELVLRIEKMQQEIILLRKEVEMQANKQEESNKNVATLTNEITDEISNVRQDVAAAGEWLQPDTLIHMAGYADVGYTDSEGSEGSFKLGSFSPIFHFQYRDLVMLESELEFSVGENGETEVALEYLSVDWFINDYVTLIAGKFLSPVGQFRQNLHPSWINKLASAGPGFGHDGAAPVSDVGFQLRGGFPLGEWRTNYSVFMSNGPELKAEFEDGEYGLDGIEAEGFGADRDGNKVIGGRFGVIPFPGFEFGLSLATGDATVTSVENGDSTLLSNEGARDYDVLGFDFNFQKGAFGLRGEYVESEVGADSRGVAASDGAIWETWYTQAAYRLGQSNWEVVARYTDFNSPHAVRDQKQWAFGSNYLFNSNFVGKFTFEFNDGLGGSIADQDRILVQMAYGF